MKTSVYPVYQPYWVYDLNKVRINAEFPRGVFPQGYPMVYFRVFFNEVN